MAGLRPAGLDNSNAPQTEAVPGDMPGTAFVFFPSYLSLSLRSITSDK